jgi:hypothetical protein
VAQIHQLTAPFGDRLGSHSARPLVGFRDDVQGPKLNSSDQRQTEVLNEKLCDLIFRKIRAGKIKTKSLGSQPAAVGELDLGVEMGSVFGHSR